jgi:ABC-2 type transport system ATP-binding protein
MLSIQQLGKSYGDRPALKGLDLTLPRGQFCVLLGPNGAGKSTLFQLLSGLFVPGSGSITVDGLPLRTQASRALARIGVVFQQQSLDLDLSVRQNLRFHADLHGLRSALAQERISQGAAALGLSADLDRPVRELSGGTRRKVELVRALLHRPGLLLMDEATVGLDPPSRHDILRTVREDVQQRQTTVLWATHWVEEAAHADRVLVLHRGELLADGSPAEVTESLGGATLEQGFIQRTASTGRKDNAQTSH